MHSQNYNFLVTWISPFLLSKNFTIRCSNKIQLGYSTSCHTLACTHTHTCMYVHTYIHTHGHICTHTYTYITHTQTHVCTYIRMYVQSYIHIHTHTYVRTYIHTYIHTYGTAQFKVDKTRVWHVLDTTRFSFCTRAGMRVLARPMT